MNININCETDLLFLGKDKILKKTNLDNNIYSTNNINCIVKDFNKYKKSIKNKINNLYLSYLELNNKVDLSNNVDAKKEILGNNNENKKINGYFFLFINELIENIKSENIKNEIQEELVEFSNKKDKSNLDNSLNNLNNTNDAFFKNNNKNSTIDNFIQVKKVNLNNKILPKKRN